MSHVTPYLTLIRPGQWIKNAFVLAPLLFSLELTNVVAFQAALLATICFCFMASGVYILNDYCDRDADRKHPIKKNRPIAKGSADPTVALMLAGALVAASLVLCGLYLSFWCLMVLLIYVVLQLLYSTIVKHIALLDVLCIAIGYVLRVVMGGIAIEVPLSAWILVTTFLLALFLGFGKRYHEFATQNNKRHATIRPSLKAYNTALLDRLISISCGTTLLSYALYTVEASTLLNEPFLVASVVFVAFGLFRYLQLIYTQSGGGSPEKTVVQDPVSLINVLLWLGCVSWLLYP